jgi:flagellar protein FliS
MSSYQDHALESASAVDLVVALYDGIIRFLRAAATSAVRGDEHARRLAVKRALDIIIHLQARLRMDVGGTPAQALSEFYASIFAQVLQASQANSRDKFDHAIECVRNVRDAWKQVAHEQNDRLSSGAPFFGEERRRVESPAGDHDEGAGLAESWTA